MATPDLNPSLTNRRTPPPALRDSRGPERVTNETATEPVVHRPVGFAPTSSGPAGAPDENPGPSAPSGPDTDPLLWEGDQT